ncbi:hypothetical protein FKP32DRAFT_1670471 [Trametes sanguinea]|nr:hypothetical protein FKP32DRAFT_1670471 [Trametes sanguinea]
MCPHPEKRMWTGRNGPDSMLVARQGGLLGDVLISSTEFAFTTTIFEGFTSTRRMVSEPSNTAPAAPPTTTPTAGPSDTSRASDSDGTPSPTPTSSADPESSDTWEPPATTSQAINAWDSNDNQPTSQWSSTGTSSFPVQTTTQLETTLVSVPYTVSVSESSDSTTSPLVSTSTATSPPDQNGAQQASSMVLTGTEIAAICAGAAAMLVFGILLWWAVRRCKRDRSDAVDAEPEIDQSWTGHRRSPVTIVPDVEAAFDRTYDAPSQISPVQSSSHYAEASTRMDTLGSIEGNDQDKEEIFQANSSRESLIAEEPSVRSSSTLSYINTLCPETAESPSTAAAARALPPVPSYNNASNAPHLGPPYHPPQVVGFRPLPLPVPPTPFASMYVPEERASLDSAAYGSVEATVSVYSTMQDGGVVRCTGGVYAESADGQPPEYSRY